MARSAWRRVERFALGVVFGVAAWIIERRVLRAIRRKGLSPPRGSMAEEATGELERPLP
jgi:hypothetical protein